MISEDVRRQIKAGESEVTAFVGEPADFDAIAANLCAFLNTHGGVVFVGVGLEGKIVGVGDDAEAIRRKLETDLQAAISPKALFTASVDVESGVPIVSIEAPAGRDGPYAAQGRYFIRKGKQSLPPDDQLLSQIVQEQSVAARRWERRPSLELGEDNLVASEIKATKDNAALSGRFSVAQNIDQRSFLTRLGLVAPSTGLTQACDVLFAEHPEQRHPQCRVRFVRYASDKTGDKYLDNQWLEGPLAQICDHLVERLSRHVNIQALFHPDHAHRKDKPNYSLEALREGVVNALAHRDYAAFSSGATISVYESRVEIWNSGRIPAGLKVADFKKPHASIPTNPDIAYVLYLRGLMERLGRGTQKILRGCSELGAPPPKWVSKSDGITLIIYAAGARAVESISLNIRQTRLMERLRPGDAIRVVEYIRGETEPLSERQARRDLAELEEVGLLTKVGQARATVYRRTEQAL